LIGSAILATWFPEAASTHAAGVDGPFYWIYVLAVLALVVFAGLVGIFMRTYRRQDPGQKGAPAGRPNPVFVGLWVLAALGLVFPGSSTRPSRPTAPTGST
jgi:heme/copper-type cytochrome/quinol oxidase subunit 2